MKRCKNILLIANFNAKRHEDRGVFGNAIKPLAGFPSSNAGQGPVIIAAEKALRGRKESANGLAP